MQKKLIQKTTDNLNSIASTKYCHLPEEVEVKCLKDDKFREIYDFYGLVKAKKNSDRTERNNLKKDNLNKRRLREPFNIGEKILILAERLKKKDAPRNPCKSTTAN